MRCKNVKKLLGTYLDDELSERKERKIQRHLAKCSSCCWELKSFQNVDKLGQLLSYEESAELSEYYWEGYLTEINEKLGQEAQKSPDAVDLLRRYWYFPLAFSKNWFRKIAPVLVAFIFIAVLVTGITNIHYHSSETVKDININSEKVAINLYLKEHENAIMQVSQSKMPSGTGFELGYEDVFYYDTVRRGLDRERPGDTGVFLRYPRRPSYLPQKESSPMKDISNGHNLSLQKAQEAVSFKIIAPQFLHPGYFLENIRKVEKRECLQFIYSNGINTLSLFQQPLISEERLQFGDFSEYIMYSKKGEANLNIIGWNSREVSFSLIGAESFPELMDIVNRIQDEYWDNRTSG